MQWENERSSYIFTLMRDLPNKQVYEQTWYECKYILQLNVITINEG